MAKCIRCGKECANGEQMCEECKAWFQQKSGGTFSAGPAREKGKTAAETVKKEAAPGPAPAPVPTAAKRPEVTPAAGKKVSVAPAPSAAGTPAKEKKGVNWKVITIAAAVIVLLIGSYFVFTNFAGFGSSAPKEQEAQAEDDTVMEYEASADSSVHETMYVVNCTDCISFYDNPAIDANVISYIPLGTEVTLLEAEDANGFCTVSYDGKTGYVLSEYLSETAPEESVASADVSYYVTMYVVNCSDSISLFDQASISANVISYIPFGTPVSVIGTEANGFYNISYEGKTGYALAEYLSETKQEQVVDEPDQQVMYVVNCEEWISLRKSPDTSAQRLAKIPLGEMVAYVGPSSNGFYEITYNGMTGYALAEYLSFSPVSQKSSASSSSNVSYTTMYVVNCNEYITLRKSASTSASALDTIPKGASVSYVETASNGFYKVIYNGQTGYALAQYLSTTKSSSSSSSSSSSTKYMKVVNCNEWISLREGPDTTCEVICTIPLGSTVTYVSGPSSGFYKVKYNGNTGYALADYLTFK